jgi:K+-transporting ATPase ATPase C chain
MISMKIIIKQIRTAARLLAIFIILTGIIYPGIVTGIAQLLFPWQANGSMIEMNNKMYGSKLIGQGFTQAKYFWSRPSATTPFAYNAESSAGSNLSVSNPQLIAQVQARIKVLKQSDPKNKNLIPVDLVTASGSGLDPDISPAAAFYQVSRIARARHISEQSVQSLIYLFMNKCSSPLLSEKRVNVLQLNLALDNMTS